MLPVAHTLEEIPAGTPGLDVKLVRLRELVEASKRNPSFRRFVLDVVKDVREGDWSGELGAVSRWIRQHVTYRHDPIGVELFTSPDRLAFDGVAGEAAGDCDDMVALGAAMAEVLGHPSRFRVGGSRIAGRETWSHIWRETYDKAKRRWVAFDDTAKKRPPGWSPERHYELGRVTPAGEVGRLPGMADNRVGVPVYDEDGNAVPGLAQFVDDLEGNTADGSLGFGRSVRRLGRRMDRAGRKTATKVVGKRNVKRLAKVGRAVAPVAAMAVNIIPGAGQVASAALSAAIANDKRIQAKKAARVAGEREEAAFRQEEAAWNAEQDRLERERMRPAIVETPMAMELPPPQGDAVVPGDQSPELPFEESVPPAPIAAAEPPEAPPADAFDPSWADDTEQDTLGSDWGAASGMQRKMPRWLRRGAGSRIRQGFLAVQRAHERAGLGFDWGSVVNTAISAGTQYAAAGGFGRRAQRGFQRYQPAIQTAQQAVAPLLTRPRLAPPVVRPAPIVPPSTRGAAGGGAGGMGVAVAAVAALLLLGKGRR